MKEIKITDSVLYIGVNDKTLDLFESQYVIPNGVSYNSYVILDEKVTVMDTVDARATKSGLLNLTGVSWEENQWTIWLYLIWNRIMRQMYRD